MNKTTVSFLLLVSTIIASTSSVFSQYEHKFSGVISAGVSYPFGLHVNLYDEDPYAISSFEGGSTINLGLHFNSSKAFTLAFNIGYTQSNTWQQELANSDQHPFNDKLSMSNVSFGLAPKLFFNSKSKVRVYGLIEISANYINLVYEDNNNITKIVDNNFGLGIHPVIGLDIKLGEKMGIFLQNGLAIVMFSNDEIEEFYSLQKDNFNALQIELGFRYNFLKSKKI